MRWMSSAIRFTSKFLGRIIKISRCRLYNTAIINQSEQNQHILLRVRDGSDTRLYILSHCVYVYFQMFKWSTYPNVLRNPLSSPSVYNDTISPMCRTLVVEFILTTLSIQSFPSLKSSHCSWRLTWMLSSRLQTCDGYIIRQVCISKACWEVP